MESIEIVIIICIILIQCYLFFNTWSQINTISNFLSSDDNIKLDHTKIDLIEEENPGKKIWEYKKLAESIFCGRMADNSEPYELSNIHLMTNLRVGDKVRLDNNLVEPREAVIDSIFKDGKYVESASANTDVELQLDAKVYKDDFLFKVAEAKEPLSKIVNVSVIYIKDETSEILRAVVSTINNYLRKNKGGAADFHLIKDIVERHCDAVDEEINHRLPVPIYLGLMGTVVGIIIGLFSLNFQFDPETNALNGALFVDSVSGLISGVKLAMICSLVGLTMTTILSSWLYRGAKSKLEEQKNMFYDFIQTKLLPQMSKDAAATILALQANLEKFNSSFQDNVKGFEKIMNDIHSTFDSQVELQRELQRMDLTQVANLNVNVLAELRRSMSEFERFTQYLSQMNSFVRSTARLTDSINDQLQRTEAVETIVQAMEENIQKNQLVMEKLRVFLERVNEHHAVITAAGEIDSAMSQAISELRAHTEEQIRSIRTYTTEATSDLHDLVTSERGHLRNLDNLSKLDALDRLVSAINDMKNDNRAVVNELQDKIRRLATSGGPGPNAGFSIPIWIKIVIVIMCLCAIYCTFRLNSLVIMFEYDANQPNTENIEAVDTMAVDTAAVDTVPFGLIQ